MKNKVLCDIILNYVGNISNILLTYNHYLLLINTTYMDNSIILKYECSKYEKLKMSVQIFDDLTIFTNGMYSIDLSDIVYRIKRIYNISKILIDC